MYLACVHYECSVPRSDNAPQSWFSNVILQLKKKKTMLFEEMVDSEVEEGKTKDEPRASCRCQKISAKNKRKTKNGGMLKGHKNQPK